MNSGAVSVLKHILNFKGSVKIVLKIKKWAQKNNSATLSPTGQNEAETSVLSSVHQIKICCTALAGLYAPCAYCGIVMVAAVAYRRDI